MSGRVPPNIQAFEEDFKKACLAHGVTAAWVVAVDDGERGSLLYVGGSTPVSDFVERCLAPNTTEGLQPKH